MLSPWADFLGKPDGNLLSMESAYSKLGHRAGGQDDGTKVMLQASS